MSISRAGDSRESGLLPNLVSFLALISACLLALGAQACGGGDTNGRGGPTSPPASRTAAATETPTGAGCPVAASVCAFAEEVARAVRLPDFGEIVANARAQEYACPSPRPPGLGGPYPLCDGASIGESRSGYEIAYLSSEGVVVDAQDLRGALDGWTAAADPSASDALGDGGNRLYTIGCASGDSACAERFALIFSQLRSGVPVRIELILYFEQPQTGDPQLVWTAIGPLLEADQERAALSGGSKEGFLTLQGWPPLTTFHSTSQ